MIEQTYSPDGQHAYHPKMLIKVLVYGYSIGIRSSRKLADRLNEDIVFMRLSSRQTPDFRTIADFRKDRLIDVKSLFIQVLSLCQELGLVRVGKVCLDGSKIKADANRMLYRKVLKKRQARITELVDDIFAEAEKLDLEEDKLLGNSTEHHIPGFNPKVIEQKLKPMVREVEANTKGPPQTLITDSGYGIKTNYRFLKKKQIAAFVPYNTLKQDLSFRRQGFKPLPPKKIDKELERYKLLQKIRYLSPQNKKLLDRRKHDVEPTFGNLKRNLNFRHFYLRGRPKCLIELGLISLAQNLKKLKNYLLDTSKFNLSTLKLGYLPS